MLGVALSREIANLNDGERMSRRKIPPADCGLLAVGRKLVPVSEDLFGFLYLLIQTGKVELHFPGSSGDHNLNGRQTAPLIRVWSSL